MTFTVGVAQELGLPDASFGVVTCALAMHHIPATQRAAALREMYRVTKPGGHLLAADFFMNPGSKCCSGSVTGAPARRGTVRSSACLALPVGRATADQPGVQARSRASVRLALGLRTPCPSRWGGRPGVGHLAEQRQESLPF